MEQAKQKIDNTMNARRDDAGYNNRIALKPGRVTEMRKVYDDILKPHYADTGRLPPYDDRRYQYARTEEDVRGMREAGLLAAQVLDYAESLCEPGVTTEFIDERVHMVIIDAGAYPSPLNYGQFPKSVCTSLNECICHGIPTPDEQLIDGDIINVDVTVYLNGYHGDTSRTIRVGKVTDEVEKLCKVTEDALEAAIKIVRPGVPIRKIGATIHEIADKHKFGVVDKFVGHGVGKEFHSGPTIRHHRNNDFGDIELGMTFTIEPMLTIGSTRDVMWKDGWTSCTADGKWTAQCEHTLLVTETGCEILTLSPAKKVLGDHFIRGKR
jgi:methionyl aminopeptidase